MERHGMALLRLAIMLTGNRADAEDAVQDALIAVAMSPSGVGRTAGLSYLRRAVSNRAIDILRGRRDVTMEQLPDAPKEDYGFLRMEQDRAFFARVDVLPLKQRATVVLRYYADLDDRAIAEILGVSVQTVRSQAHHALTKLRAASVEREGIRR
jgi:RNA polymerase sigma factor (sigma-70 family)